MNQELPESNLHYITTMRRRTTIYKMVETLAEEQSLENKEIQKKITIKTTDYIIGQYQQMTDYLKPVFSVLFLTFEISGFFYGQKKFSDLPNNTRRKQIQSWKQSTIHIFQDFIRANENLFVIGYYSYSKWLKNKKI